MLKVLHIGKFYPPHRGGMETHLESLCQAMKHQVQLEVLVANGNRSECSEVIDGIPVTRLGTWAQIARTSICPKLVKAIRSREADVVHIHWPNPLAVIAWLASGHPGKLVFTYHSDVIKQKFLGQLFDPFLNRALRQAAAIISAAPQNVEASSVLSRFREKCTLVPFGIPLEPWLSRPSEKVAEIKRLYPGQLLFAVGRLVYYKGFQYLIEAMKNVNATLLIAGTGPLREKLLQTAADCGVAARVHLLGEVEDIAPYYHACDVFVLPSVARSEAFGLVQLEAMATGKPVVNTWLPSGVPYVSLDKVTGFTVPPADPASLSASLSRLLSDDELRERYGAAALHRVQSEFSLQRMADRTLAVYEQALTRDRVPQPQGAYSWDR